LPFDQTQQERVLQAVAQWARTYAVATILGMEWLTAAGRQMVACVAGHDAVGGPLHELEPKRPPMQHASPGNSRMPKWSVTPSRSSAKAPHESLIWTGPLDPPPLALRWSSVMQRNSFWNSSIALQVTALSHMTCFGWT
jgi:hypothetical protein